ncbi:MAG: PCMD domain-containing protein [Paludibacter sp.]|nr:PCMD domain-containing protein [Bacteroidales bacterium]MCM1068327.1 PCMD domain-containing protein [Prevotella sp.]MCM1354045.1 PCMD domain-containing protein [Bacteroides sp.]MCM1442113.1 PCMD domain-containing protein [Muribaculum sp.]MCM1481994.1 PCMD domain-containing protein [Paludibacter sp.]
MKRFSLCCMVCLMAGFARAEQIVEPVPFGDFESWAVRYIKESGLIGGKTRLIYAIAPIDTIRANQPFDYEGVYRGGHNPWSVSNAYAKVSGIEKASGTTVPERRGNGWCCRMDAKMEEVVAFGCIDLKVLVNGTIFTGRTIEPIRTAKDPYQNIDFGVAFTRKPVALMFDYKALISDEHTVMKAKGFGAPKQIQGHDEAEAYLLLQKRWEDAEGNIHALRIGTACERFTKSQREWKNNHTVPVHYGDISKEPFYRSYMGLTKPYRAMNSKGKIVPILEEGWGTADDVPTHMIIVLTSGCYEAFVGHEGNSFWVDNVKLVFDK